MTDGCGLSSIESSAKQDRLGLLSKIVLDCSLFRSGGGSRRIWKKQDTKFNVSVFRLQAWEHRTSEKERLLLPTPAASQLHKPVRPMIPSEKAGTHGVMLNAAIGMLVLPTPKSSDHKRMKVAPSDLNRHSPGIPVFAAILQENLPTPTCKEEKIRNRTPSEHPGGSRRGCGLGAEIGTRVNSLIGKRIHPQFVEWMMGFPPEWTNPECKLSATQLCRECFTRSSGQSEQSKKEENK